MIESYEEWLGEVPQEIRGDVLWRVEVYRLALFLGDLAWYDATKLMRDRRTVSVADQLFRAVGAISPDIAEGYSRSTGKDRARFYEYALGSARESRDWYFKARHVLGESVMIHRLSLLTAVTRLLLTMIPQQRTRQIREASTPYSAFHTEQSHLEALLAESPLPI